MNDEDHNLPNDDVATLLPPHGLFTIVVPDLASLVTVRTSTMTAPLANTERMTTLIIAAMYIPETNKAITKRKSMRRMRGIGTRSMTEGSKRNMKTTGDSAVVVQVGAGVEHLEADQEVPLEVAVNHV